MAEELQNLLDRIQKDGVEKAEAEAQSIIGKAKEKSSGIIKDAEAKSSEIIKKAEQDAKAFEQRGAKALEQAARDVVLSVGESVNSAMKNIVSEQVSSTMSGDTLKNLISKVIESYCADKSGASSIELYLNDKDKVALKDIFIQKFKDKMENGLEMKSDNSVIAGFKVSTSGQSVQHDFTSEAVTEALCKLLRPHLAEIVKKSASK